MPGVADIVFLGAAPAKAKVLCIFVHGRSQSPEEMEAAVIRRLSAPDVAFALPRAEGKSWYTARAIDPLTEATRTELSASLQGLASAITNLRAKAPGLQLVLAGFSQGACLSLEHAFTGQATPDAVAAFTGCRVGLPGDDRPANLPSGLPVYLSAGSADPWIPVQAFAETAAALGQAEAKLRCDVFPGRPHEVSVPEIAILDSLLTDLAAGRPPPDGGPPMTRPFTFPGLTTRVVFGHGTLAQVPDEVARLGHSRALVLSTPHQQAEAQALADSLGAKAAGVFASATMHTPVEVTEEAIAAFHAAKADCVVSLGGGSTTGLGKAIAVRTGADQIVVPTTYAGSEMTDILGETSGGEKTTRRDPAIRPEVVVYDVDLTLTLPVALTFTSALNAIAHAMEGFYAPDRNPVTEALSRDAMTAFRDALPVLIQDPKNADARAKALYAAWGCSLTLGQVTMALHHKLAHVLGGSFGLPHAETHAVLLPHTTAYNEPAVDDLLKPIADTFGHGSAGKGLWHFAKSVSAPMRLADLGLTAQDLDRATDIATKNPYANPRPVTRDGIRQLLQQAFDGHCPA